jgi:hypothetical protein
MPGDIVESHETFSFVLSDPQGATISASSIDVTIVNDDHAALPAPTYLSLSGLASVQEGDSGPTLITYTVARTGDLSGTTTVQYATVTDSYGSVSVVFPTELSPEDFTDRRLPGGDLTFAPGETTKRFIVSINGDRVVEADERLSLYLKPSGSEQVISPPAVYTKVLNDDVAEYLSLVSPGSVFEGAPFRFIVTRSDASKASSFSYEVGGASEHPAGPDDFGGGAFPKGIISFAAGETSKVLVIQANVDTTAEGDEGFGVIFKNSSGDGLATAGLTILNADIGAVVAAAKTAFTNILQVSPAGADVGLVQGLANQIANGTVTFNQAATQFVNRAVGTTSVATLAYEFFTQHAPTAPGMEYLVAPTGPNPNNLNSAYYQGFNVENRYINFAVNLGKLGEGRDTFAAAYGAKSLLEATRSAYTTIFGTAPTEDKIHALIDGRADYFATYGGDGQQGIGTKAAMVGWLLAEAAKADVGMYAKVNDAFLIDLADGAAFGVDLVATYGKPEYGLI